MDINDFAVQCKAEAREAQGTGLCVDCGLPALPRCYSEAGRREFTISGLCEKCFDSAFDKDEL
jgi:hypothetical protein